MQNKQFEHEHHTCSFSSSPLMFWVPARILEAAFSCCTFCVLAYMRRAKQDLYNKVAFKYKPKYELGSINIKVEGPKSEFV